MKRTFCIIVLILTFFSVFAQDKETTNTRDMFLEAESYFLYEEYTEALPIYLKLLKADPENDNYNYKVGVCYLNIPYEKEKSINYLEKAVKNINPNYKTDNIKEKQAPLDALFFLGNAYRINNELSKASKTYFDFKDKLNPEIYDENLVDEQIKAVERAKRYEAKPIFFKYTNLGEPLNSKFSETNAVVSGDEKTLIYDVKLQFYDALYYSTYEEGKWSNPINIIPELGVDGDVYSTGLSYDGKELFIYRSDNYDGNLYVSRLVKNVWTPIKRLNDNINTKYWESHASISHDGLTMYFTSNRKGGYGGLDIYKATRINTSKDDWQNVTNLGPDVNTPYNEETPFISDDSKILYYSSYGHFNMGGYDIFYTTLLDNGKWSAPLNMGYPLNTTDDDIFFVPVQNGNFGYVCRYYDNNLGKTDIYKVEIFSDQHPRKFLLKGLVSLPSDIEKEKLVTINAVLIDKSTRDTVQHINIDPLKLQFDTKITAGKYQLVIQGKGLQKTTEELRIESNQANDVVTINSILQSQKKDVVAIKPTEPIIGSIEFAKNFYKVFENNKLYINLNLEKGTSLNVNEYIDSSLIKTEKLVIKKVNQKFVFIPSPGKNILKFEATSPNNIISRGEIVVIYEQLTDTISKEELVEKLKEKQNQLNYTKNILATLAGSRLKKVLQELNIEKENLSSLNELKDYLKANAQKNGYTSEEVDNLFAQYLNMQLTANSLFINALSDLSSDKLKPVVDSLWAEIKDKNLTDVINVLLEKTKNRNNDQLELLAITSRLADQGNAYYYLSSLKKIAKGELKETLDTLSLRYNNINKAEDLLILLIEKSDHNGYSKEEVFESFFAIPVFTTNPAALLATMAVLSDDGIKKFLLSFDVSKKEVKTIKELGSMLLAKAKLENISQKELVELLIKSNSESYYRQFCDDLLRYSTGKLNNKIKNCHIVEQQIKTVSELVNYIFSLSENNKQDTEAYIKLFAQIASKNLLATDTFKPTIDKTKPLSIINISLIVIFLIMFAAIVFFAFRNKSNTF